MGRAERAVGPGAWAAVRGGRRCGGTRGRVGDGAWCLQVPPSSPKPSHPLIISESPAPDVPKARLSPINEGEVGKG